ncbi:MAG: HAD-IC family P-type ATPase, partial [Phaeodactylibacter sp.]|nr:HAD-IC family P-type ATPase [Phaeodactylibacter sp.]
MNWHLISGEEALELAGSRPGGLTASEAEERLAQYGPNRLAAKKRKPAWLMFLGQFRDVMILILIAAAIVSGLVGDLKDTIVILIIVVLNAVVGFVQEYRAEKALEALKKMSAPTAIVLRGGAPMHIDAAQLVPGDVVLLEAGSMVPADIRLLETHSLKVEEANLTGESAAVEKQAEELQGAELPLGDRTNMAYKSTIATYGRGRGVVAATAMDTEIGRIAQMLQEDEALTPLQKRLGDFGRKLSLAVLAICAILYGVGLLRGEDSLNMLLTSISVAVAAIPEALPAVVTIALALGARRLVRKNALIRKLPAVETLGSVTFICTDKTGTLTENRMTVTETWTPPAPPAGISLPPEQALLLCMALNHDVQKDAAGELAGESTEVALAAYAAAHPPAPGFSREQYPRVAELPFDSERKMMTTVHEYEGRFLSITKGALESVLAACEDAGEDALTAEAERMGRQGLRTLAYGCRLLERLPEEISFATLERGLEAAGLAGMMDPPRAE